ncbi:hypothetical protein CD30_16650 [Ureibacillus massiliensis 4400831 = CIP 108448 = CCUG 49529]|uniref:Group-specific protein n=1 Tax=Ureibacillus massiliensis 4400831 = CIP 108448 = CCUG 49529 TaxID=1211035 RepID=A0A0A3IXM3_9BACL|nr:hypothetical protein [Ureibacillus massiliensis]KGR89524.1 hypothetical protein CD30_16650 [Ureibacillus massiliensis 4400831 = CIP 108448 = CCUG 49529]RKJ46309.1 hypothetical protein D7X33_34330 [Butyricicoccus sp. 1XD8-22]
MDKSKRIIATLIFIVFLLIAGFSLYKWIRYGTIDAASIFFSFLILSYFFNWLNWGDHNGGGKKDELDKHIQAQSAKISYYVLMILSGLLLFISEGTGNFNEIDNYPLVMVVGLTFVTVPITEFIYSKKYK